MPLAGSQDDKYKRLTKLAAAAAAAKTVASLQENESIKKLPLQTN